VENYQNHFVSRLVWFVLREESSGQRIERVRGNQKLRAWADVATSLDVGKTGSSSIAGKPEFFRDDNFPCPQFRSRLPSWEDSLSPI
jgi:hypothetical protein